MSLHLQLHPCSLFPYSPHIFKRGVYTCQPHFLSSFCLLNPFPSGVHPQPSTDSSYKVISGHHAVQPNGWSFVFDFLAAFDTLSIPFFLGILHLPSMKPLSWFFPHFISHCLSLSVVSPHLQFGGIPLFRSETSFFSFSIHSLGNLIWSQS